MIRGPRLLKGVRLMSFPHSDPLVERVIAELLKRLAQTQWHLTQQRAFTPADRRAEIDESIAVVTRAQELGGEILELVQGPADGSERDS